MTNIKLSIITALYNTPEKYLLDILSFLDLVSSSIEWVCINDSPDNEQLKNTMALLMKDRPFIKLYSNEKNLGIVDSILHGMRRATAPYVCTLDHDDVFSPVHILEHLDGKSDLVYTDEFKFFDLKKGKASVYQKPEYDLLSIPFYFYTHHVTAVRTPVIQEIIGNSSQSKNKYSAIYDLDIFMSYISHFNGKKFHVVHVNHDDYGWRMSDTSTSNDLNQKPACFIERLQRVEEFFLEFNETPLVKLDNHYGYLVEANFFSCLSELQSPMGFDSFKQWIIENRFENGNSNYSLTLDYDELVEEEILNLFNMLKRIPLYYLQSNHIENVFIPSVNNQENTSKEMLDFHIPNVPMISMRNIDEIEQLKMKGALLSKIGGDSKTLGILLMKKHS